MRGCRVLAFWVCGSVPAQDTGPLPLDYHSLAALGRALFWPSNSLSTPSTAVTKGPFTCTKPAWPRLSCLRWSASVADWALIRHGPDAKHSAQLAACLTLGKHAMPIVPPNSVLASTNGYNLALESSAKYHRCDGWNTLASSATAIARLSQHSTREWRRENRASGLPACQPACHGEHELSMTFLSQLEPCLRPFPPCRLLTSQPRATPFRSSTLILPAVRIESTRTTS